MGWPNTSELRLSRRTLTPPAPFRLLNNIFKRHILFSVTCVCVSLCESVQVSAFQVTMECRRDCQSTGACLPPEDAGAGTDSRPLEEQQALITAKLSLQPSYKICSLKRHNIFNTSLYTMKLGRGEVVKNIFQDKRKQPKPNQPTKSTSTHTFTHRYTHIHNTFTYTHINTYATRKGSIDKLCLAKM